MGQSSTDILGRVNHLAPGDSSRELYDDWSSDYDEHLQREFGYISPEVAAHALAAEVDVRQIDIIDYGCGTGFVGVALEARGFKAVDGVDNSRGMLQQARAKGVYRQLICADLTGRIALGDEAYDAGFCVGSMGAGHIAAGQVAEMLRPLRSGGLFIVIINGMHYAPEGFERVFRRLQDDGLWRIRRFEEFNYMTAFDRPGWILLAEKICASATRGVR